MEKIIRVKLTFLTEILGTSPNDPDIYRTYIGKKSPDAASLEEEVKALGADAVTEHQMTVFPTLEDGTPFLWDYQIKGFFKSTSSCLKKCPDKLSSKLQANKKLIDQLIFIYPRQIPFEGVEEIFECQRPLRASTPQGDRTTLAISEKIPAGATVTFDIKMYNDSSYSLIKEWLNYGEDSGIGQWRNASYGRFTWEEV